jgi:prenyltransferase beta subunit
MNGVYWGLVALCIMGRQDALDRDEMIRYVMSCWDEDMGQSRRVTSVHSSCRLAEMLLC